MRPLFGARTVIEAAFLVAVPVIALEVGLSWPVIIEAGGTAYVFVLAVEGAIWRESKRERAPARAAEVQPEDVEPVPVTAALPEPEPELPPVAAVVPITSSSGPRQWNVWDLERVSREQAGGDPVADEERAFLLLYLRDFADPDGLLPVDFDELVRQSFGGLVANL